MNALRPAVFDAGEAMRARSGARSFDIQGAIDFIRTVAEDNRRLQALTEGATAQAATLREQVSSERAARDTDRADYEAALAQFAQKAADAKALAVEAQAIARAAVTRYEAARSQERSAFERAEAAEARARELEDWLDRIQETMVAEFSQLMPAGRR